MTSPEGPPPGTRTGTEAALAEPVPAPDPPAQVRNRGRRIAAWAAAGVVASAGALFGLDRGAEALVEQVVAGRVQDCLGTPDEPAVEIGGFPLLPDLARGRLERMDLTARDANAEGVRVEGLRVRARGLERGDGGGRVDSLSGSGLVSYDAMSARAGGLEVSYAGAGQLRVGGGFGLLRGAATATPSIVDGALVLDPGRVSSPLLGDFDLGGLGPISFDLRELPAGVEVDLTPTERGLEFAFDGTDVRLPEDSCAG